MVNGNEGMLQVFNRWLDECVFTRAWQGLMLQTKSNVEK